jgi:hypothetical protein
MHPTPGSSEAGLNAGLWSVNPWLRAGSWRTSGHASTNFRAAPTLELGKGLAQTGALDVEPREGSGEATLALRRELRRPKRGHVHRGVRLDPRHRRRIRRHAVYAAFTRL